jgi:hypothetical protein
VAVRIIVLPNVAALGAERLTVVAPRTPDTINIRAKKYKADWNNLMSVY